SRFERGADWAMPPLACDRAAALIAEVSGGLVAPGLLDAYPQPLKTRRIDLRPDRVTSLLGPVQLPADECRRILDLLGCRTSVDGGVVAVEVPSFRPDLEREVDLIEEVGRVHGYDRIQGATHVSAPIPSRPSPQRRATARVRQCLTALGVDEVVTSTIVDRSWVDRFGSGDGDPWVLSNPPAEGQDRLRTTLIPSLLDAARRNFNQRAETVCIFELGTRFRTCGGERAEDVAVAGLWSGWRCSTAWRSEREAVDFLDLKGLIEALLDGLSPQFSPSEHRLLRPGHTAGISLGDRVVGHLGEVSSPVRDAFDLASPVYIFELSLAPLVQAWRGPKAGFRPLPKFPPIERDLAVVLKEDTAAAQVMKEIRAARPELIEAVELFDTYKGDQLGPDEKSLAFSIRMRSEETTLEDRQADAAMARIVKRLTEAFGARLR
ncbi:phenylalanine--tRNA ligase subunit beta, partial [Candidatus Latescibacterota bacterium]